MLHILYPAAMQESVLQVHGPFPSQFLTGLHMGQCSDGFSFGRPCITIKPSVQYLIPAPSYMFNPGHSVNLFIIKMKYQWFESFPDRPDLVPTDNNFAGI